MPATQPALGLTAAMPMTVSANWRGVASMPPYRTGWSMRITPASFMRATVASASLPS